MGAIRDLWKSERGLVVIALTACVTVFVLVGRMTIEQWLEFEKWLSIAYLGSKTVTGAVETYTESKKTTATADAVAADANLKTAKIEAQQPPAVVVVQSPGGGA